MAYQIITREIETRVSGRLCGDCNSWICAQDHTVANEHWTFDLRGLHRSQTHFRHTGCARLVYTERYLSPTDRS